LILSGENWRKQLAAWAIPKEILDQAEESPWIHPPALFEIPEIISDTPSHQIAREVLSENSSVLDIGCGGGIAAFALVPPASFVFGVDHQPEMLEMFTKNAQDRQVKSDVALGFWPEVASQTPLADVVTAHHVLYNVPQVESFLQNMNEHALKRVVIEIPTKHPLSNMSELWRHFWRLERPDSPDYSNLLEVVTEMGFEPKFKVWSGEMRSETNIEQAAEFMRIRLCLPKSRVSDVKEFLQAQPKQSKRELATIWWDKK
jgi:SAM-dependent methyltransferase